MEPTIPLLLLQKLSETFRVCLHIYNQIRMAAMVTIAR